MLESGERERGDGYAVCDEAGFGGHVWWCVGGGDAEAAVVADEGVGVGDAGHGAVDGGTVAEDEGACVLVVESAICCLSSAEYRPSFCSDSRFRALATAAYTKIERRGRKAPTP